MNKIRILTVVLASLANNTEAGAVDISNAAIAGLVLNNTIPDNDFYALNLFAGRSTTDILSTTSLDTNSNFGQSLTGTYLGESLSVDYQGISGAFPAGAITWTSTGSYGLESWNSFGTATFTFPTSATFQVAYDSSLTIGLNTMVTQISISGADDGTSLYYTGTTGTLTVNGSSMIAPFAGMKIPSQPNPYEPDDDYIIQDGRIIILSDTEIIGVSHNPGYAISDVGDLQSVPEPSSLVLASFGVLGLLAGLAFGRRGGTGGRTDPGTSARPKREARE